MFTCPGASISFGQSFSSSTKSNSSSGFYSRFCTICIPGFSHLVGSHGGSTNSNLESFGSSFGSPSSPGSIARSCFCSGSITDSSSSYGSICDSRIPFSLIFIGTSSNSCVGYIINSNYGVMPNSITSFKPGFYTDTGPNASFSIYSWWLISISYTFSGNREPSGVLSNSDIIIDSIVISGTNSRPDTVFGIRSATGSNSDTVSGSSSFSGSSFSYGPCLSSHTDFGSSIVICFTPGPSFSAYTDFESGPSSSAHPGSICTSNLGTGTSLNTGPSFPGIFPCGFCIWHCFPACHHGKPAVRS